ncbi:MAG: hypothetical protein CMB80_24520 [Flammeovirgaceae bacterium]|nr:hypothetical protein [Flammeovirgaceae bacterium]MBR10331.1 hypothetical protein [Rickettsiales bacterium]HCX24536.1 hypothetical protein [Cytophagales bacterium]|tara:strand:- start:14 stop:196 length:183 start_codon:yes stop_codon:yes gene_type:complete
MDLYDLSLGLSLILIGVIIILIQVKQSESGGYKSRLGDIRITAGALFAIIGGVLYIWQSV